MDAEHAVAIRTRHQARPGRRAIVIRDLADLSGPSPAFDLDDQFQRQWLYEIVLREASRPEDLTTYLDADTLTSLWPHLFLPRGVRQAWEEQHPALRAAAA